MKSKKVLLKKDFIIPKGTIMNDCGGPTTQYASGNYACIIGTSRDSCISFYVNEDVVIDRSDIFEYVSDKK